MEKHFAASWEILWSQLLLPETKGLAPVTIGASREFFVREFLLKHLPPSLGVSTGHVLLERGMTGQIDLVVHNSQGLILPLGNNSLFAANSVVACIEVKSELDKEHFTGQIAGNFDHLPSGVLKVIIAMHLKNKCLKRKTVQGWANDAALPSEALPDLVIILDNAAIIRGGALQCLKESDIQANNPDTLYKAGDYETQKWMGLLLLALELAQRAGRGKSLHTYIDESVFRKLKGTIQSLKEEEA